MYKFLFLFVMSFVSAQHYRFVYEYRMKPDVNKKDSIITDVMNLDTDGKKSYFYNAVKYERDSTYVATKSYTDLLLSKNYDQNLSYIVEKDYVTKTVKFYDKFKTVNLLIRDNEVPEWRIEKEFLKINNIDCQKATTNFKGRIWEAWFSKDYPVNDGPYKFFGLPGLIVSVKDSENNHVFNLIQIKKVNAIFSLLPKSTKEISFSDYKKTMGGFTFTTDDIESLSINKQSGKADIQVKDGYFVRIGLDEMKSGKLDEKILQRLKRTNNYIERD